MKIVHISHETRKGGALGGVAKFGDYLQKAIGCDVVAAGETDLNKYDIVIGDGYFVSGTNPDKQIVISVVHGSWKEFSIRNNKVPDFSGEVVRQHSVWSNPKIKKVAVSYASAKYLEKHHGIQPDDIILNGINTDLFKPIFHKHKKPIVIYVANDYNKGGQGELGKIADLLRDDFEFKYLGAEMGEEQDKFAHGDIYIQRSFYEGNSYAALEAMSCGLPVVASCAGLFECTTFTPYRVGVILPWDAEAKEYAYAIKQVRDDPYNFQPRGWILDNASFKKFKDRWGRFIKSCLN